MSNAQTPMYKGRILTSWSKSIINKIRDIFQEEGFPVYETKLPVPHIVYWNLLGATNGFLAGVTVFAITHDGIFGWRTIPNSIVLS